MTITIKLYAMLAQYLPPGSERNVGRLTLADGATIGTVVEQLNLPRQLVHLVLINGVFVPAERRTETALQEADTLAIWPPVAGG